MKTEITTNIVSLEEVINFYKSTISLKEKTKEIFHIENYIDIQKGKVIFQIYTRET